MRLDPRTRRRLRLGNAAFVVLLVAAIGLAAWLTHAHRYRSDWTAAGRNTLSQQSRDVVALVEGPVRATAYIGPDPLERESIRDLLDRYQRAGLALRLEFVNPETSPGVARELGIRSGGELILRRGERQRRLQRISEQSVTNALLQLSRDSERWVIFLSGHGERDPGGEANSDLGRFGRRLADSGLRVQTHNLARTPQLPDNADLLVIASPQRGYLPGERARIRRHVLNGGNLLWLTEPESDADLGPLAADLGIRRRPGVVVDPSARLFRTQTPDFAVISDYGRHPVTQGLRSLALFPQAAALESGDGNGWRHTDLLRTRAESWAETGTITGDIQRDGNDTAGPLVLGIAASRGAGQRIAVVGDGDFLSNAYLGNGANLDLGMRLVTWLTGDDERIQITPDRPADIAIDASRTVLAIAGLGFLVGVPALLLGAGLWVALRRRRHR